MLSQQASIAAISAASLDAVIATDRNGIILEWNDQARKIFGWTAEEAVGQYIHETIIPIADREVHIRGMDRYRATGMANIFGRRWERDGLCKDGSMIRVEFAIMHVPGEPHEALVCFARDLSEELIAQAALKDAHSQIIHLSRVSAMSTMASTIAHELNQPLTAASNYLQAAKRLIAEDANASIELTREAVTEALSAVVRASDTIRVVREMVSRRPVKFEDNSLSQMVDEATRLLSALLPVRPNVDIAPGADRVFVHKLQIEQVLINLFRNAGEAVACVPNPQISLTASLAEEAVEISVTDNGPGLNPHLLADPFAVSVSSKANGLGLGLSLCRTIIEHHGGRVWARNLSPGASIVFTLPRTNGPAAVRRGESRNLRDA